MEPFPAWKWERGGKRGQRGWLWYPVAGVLNVLHCRAACSTDAIHAPFVAGIAGSAADGAYSVALSGGYDDDVDLGYAL